MKNDPNGFKWIDAKIQRPFSNKIITTLDNDNSNDNARDVQKIQVELTHLAFPESHITHFNVNPLVSSS